MAPPLRNVPVLRWRWLLPAAVLVLAFHLSPFGPALDRSFYDLASRHPLQRTPIPEGSAIVLVDEATLAAVSKLDGLRWPFSRPAFAGLIAALERAGASRIVFDFTFFEESERAEWDLILGSVAAAVPTLVLARTQDREPVFWPSSFVSTHAALFQRPRTGEVDFQPDEDGIVRHYNVPGSLVAVAFAPPATASGGLLRWHGSLRDIKSSSAVPVLSAARFFIRGNELIRRMTAAAPNFTPDEFSRALAAEAPLTDDPVFDAVRGRTVFVGANASATFDVKPTPIGKFEPGTLIHWTAWANLSTDGFIRPLPRVAGIVFGILGCGLIVAAGKMRAGITWPALVAAGFSLVVLASAYAGMSAGWFLPPSTPVVAATLSLLGVTVESFWTEQRRKREIQAMFGSYVDPAVVTLLLRDPDAIRLGGERRAATVYFSDLVGFTDMSERIPPEQLVEITNLYLQEMSECLIGYGAYIDKYIGDAVMAVFGAPQPTTDHAIAACRGAIAARRVLAEINEQLAQSNRPALRMRIGINTGEMIVGNVGSAQKRNYTVLGDAVNLASRLEAANKQFGTDVLIGERTAADVAGKFVTRPLTLLRVKGKLRAVEVHELIGAPSDLTPVQREFLAAYGEGYALHARREFGAAAEALSRARAIDPDDPVTAELLRSATKFAHTPPAANWEPILTLETK